MKNGTRVKCIMPDIVYPLAIYGSRDIKLAYFDPNDGITGTVVGKSKKFILVEMDKPNFGTFPFTKDVLQIIED